MIIAKSSREIELMKTAGRVVAKVFETLKPMLKSGVSTYELNEAAEKVIFENGCDAPCKGYYGYPCGICISVNETLIHGIPSKKIILKEGDIVSLDVVASYRGYAADAARTYPVGITTERANKVMRVAREAFYNGVKLIKPGVRLGDVQEAIQKTVESNGYNVARDFTGHGIGKSMHEDPAIPNYGKAGTGPVLQKGYGLAIEPMVCEGTGLTRILGDGWTAKTKDGKLSAHYENTVIVTDDGYEIITLDEGENY
jgi:methionyl aminopeptidase